VVSAKIYFQQLGFLNFSHLAYYFFIASQNIPAAFDILLLLQSYRFFSPDNMVILHI